MCGLFAILWDTYVDSNESGCYTRWSSKLISAVMLITVSSNFNMPINLCVIVESTASAPITNSIAHKIDVERKKKNVNTTS